uniref:Uncharacterized protein n=1 Tax=Mustela putorius furo TaxID=9669 RepID=M3YFJ6_MUSPF
MQPVMEVILLQALFGQIFQIPFGKRHLGSYSNLAFAPFNGYHPSTEISSFSIHFDSLLKKLLKIGCIHDSIFYRVGAIKGKLQNLLLFFAPLRHQLFHGRDRNSNLTSSLTGKLTLGKLTSLPEFLLPHV